MPLIMITTERFMARCLVVCCCCCFLAVTLAQMGQINSQSSCETISRESKCLMNKSSWWWRKFYLTNIFRQMSVKRNIPRYIYNSKYLHFDTEINTVRLALYITKNASIIQIQNDIQIINIGTIIKLVSPRKLPLCQTNFCYWKKKGLNFAETLKMNG